MKEEKHIELFDDCDSRAYILLGRATDAISGKQFKQRPRIAWRYPLDEEGIQYIELRPQYITTEQDKRKFDALGMEMEYHPLLDSNFQYTGAISLDVGIEEDGEIQRSGGIFKLKEYGGLELHYLNWGDEDRSGVAESIATAVKMVIEEPEKLTALESSHCCYCGKGLLDAESVSRGYGPDCANQNNLPYVHTPTKWKDKRPEPTIIEPVGILTSLADAEMVPTEVKYYRYRKEQEIKTKIEDRALIYQGSKISKYLKPVTVITYSAMGGSFRMDEENLVKLTVEKYAQYERALNVCFVEKRGRTLYSRMMTPKYGDHSINPFCVIVEGWGHRARRTRKSKRDPWTLVSGFRPPSTPAVPEGTHEGSKHIVEADLHMQAFIEPWAEYVKNNDVKEIVRLFPGTRSA